MSAEEAIGGEGPRVEAPCTGDIDQEEGIRVMQPRAEGMSMPFVKRSVGKEICTGYRPEGVPCRLGGRNGSGLPSSRKREEDHRELSL